MEPSTSSRPFSASRRFGKERDHPRAGRYLAAALGVTLGLVPFAGPAQSATKNARKKSASCTAAQVAAPVLKNVASSAPFQLRVDGIDPSSVQCMLNNKNPDLAVVATLSLSKPGAARGRVTGSLITEVGFPNAAVQRVEANVTGSYRCAEGTCSVNARAMKAGKAIASLKGTMKPTDTRYAEYEEVAFVFHTITWTYREGGINDTTS